ncbi:universal stress protein [Sphingobium fuliginis]|uniref:Universal stress protein family 4 n=1 Tax=Sphingobium fuliginis (strain ATCC 27551) TaxID=336203 RepID=A0A292ZAD4_SPHSA|nr:universal stress protein [Sphingobium fuliginis]GAY20098.1 universal stress protein family 4 [Sphingobium fuliginis]
MEHVLACIDASSYADSVCDLAAWASKRLQMPVELLHVVQRSDPVAARGDLSGAIGLGVKTNLMQELVELEAADAKLKVERGRMLLAAGEKRLRDAGAFEVRTLHRHGGIVETILEREVDARVVVIGKRGASHEFASGHIGSKIERVVRASSKPVLIASREYAEPQNVVFAYDASPAAERALGRLIESPLYTGLPVNIVMADTDSDAHRRSLQDASSRLGVDREVKTTMERGKPEAVIARVVEETPHAMLVMGAYGHSPIRTLIVGSTTTTMIRTVHVPVLLVR